MKTRAERIAIVVDGLRAAISDIECPVQFSPLLMEAMQLLAALRAPAQAPEGAADADMRAFSASDAACYKWPDDTPEHRAARAAYCEGAADYGTPAPSPMVTEEEIRDAVAGVRKCFLPCACLENPQPQLSDCATCARAVLALIQSKTKERT